MTGISMLVFLTEAPCLFFRTSLVAYLPLSCPSAPIWWTAEITVDLGWIKDILLCAAVYSQRSHFPYFIYKHNVLFSIHHFCGSPEPKEDVKTLDAPCLPTKSVSQPQDLLFIAGDKSPTKPSPCGYSSLTWMSMRAKFSPFQRIHILLEYFWNLKQ